MMRSKKQKRIPELRFPEFANDGEWVVDKLDSLVSTVTPPKKLTSSEYRNSGKFPIIDQSKSFYCGWTNDLDAVIRDKQPLIIFGDHTCIFKIVKEPFVQGADGIKILKTNSKIIPEFLYQYVLYNEVKQEEYKRHFSILKEKNVSFPKKESGEQQKIASCLSSLDEVITAHSQKLEQLKDHKKGLMQNLFPQEGKNMPNFRFPEFENDWDWVEKELGEVAEFINGRAYKQEELLDNGKYRVLRVGNFFTNNNWYYSDLELEENKYCDDGDLLYAWSASFGPRIWKGEKVIYHYHIWKVVPTQSIDKDFLFILLDNETERMKTQNANGFALLHITKGTIENWECYIPRSKAEQQKIASCLSALDALITSQTEKIEQLKLHKKGLMQGLFPKIEN